MKRVLAFLAVILISVSLLAQQLDISSLYNLNTYEINPAVAGSLDGLPLAFSVRKAWAGFEGSPTNQLLSGHMMVVDRMGVGARIFNNTQGPLRKTGMEATYAYHLPVDDGNSIVSFGLSGMFYQYYLDKMSLMYQDIDDPKLMGNEKKIVPDAAFGIYYYSGNYFAGLSVYQLFQGRVSLDANDIDENRNIRHYFMNMGYSFDISEDFKLEPSALVKILETGVFQADINAYATYNDMVSLGLSYRSGSAMVVQLGFKNENIMAGYAYDITLSDIKTVSSGSHEIMFIYKFANFLSK